MQQVQLKTAAAPSLQKQKPNFRVSGGRGAQDRGALLHPDPSPISQQPHGSHEPHLGAPSRESSFSTCVILCGGHVGLPTWQVEIARPSPAQKGQPFAQNCSQLSLQTYRHPNT